MTLSPRISTLRMSSDGAPATAGNRNPLSKATSRMAIPVPGTGCLSFSLRGGAQRREESSHNVGWARDSKNPGLLPRANGHLPMVPVLSLRDANVQWKGVLVRGVRRALRKSFALQVVKDVCLREGSLWRCLKVWNLEQWAKGIDWTVAATMTVKRLVSRDCGIT